MGTHKFASNLLIQERAGTARPCPSRRIRGGGCGRCPLLAPSPPLPRGARRASPTPPAEGAARGAHTAAPVGGRSDAMKSTSWLAEMPLAGMRAGLWLDASIQRWEWKPGQRTPTLLPSSRIGVLPPTPWPGRSDPFLGEFCAPSWQAEEF